MKALLLTLCMATPALATPCTEFINMDKYGQADVMNELTYESTDQNIISAIRTDVEAWAVVTVFSCVTDPNVSTVAEATEVAANWVNDDVIRSNGRNQAMAEFFLPQ